MDTNDNITLWIFVHVGMVRIYEEHIPNVELNIHV